jgi:hypothetical protein
MFLDRGRRAAPGRFLRLKVQLFFAGAAMLVAGMVLKRDVLVLFAIAILAVGFVLRFFERERVPEHAGEDVDVDVDDPPEDDDPPSGAEERREDHHTS